MRRIVCVAAAIAMTASALAASSKRQRIDSHWLDRPVKIDGDNGDWAGPLAQVDEKDPINVAVENDGQSLYLVLTTSDQSVRREITRQGLVLWFDPSGGEKKHFGVKFPIGYGSENGARGGHSGGGGRGRWGGYGHQGGSGTDDPKSTPPDQTTAVEPPDRLEVYGPSKDDAHSFVVEAAPGIAAKVGQVEGYFVYELKVPLAKGPETPYAIEAKPGSEIGFGIETPKIESAEHHGFGGMGGMGGGMGGMGGGRGGGGMGGGGGRGGSGGGEGGRGGYEEPKPLKTWATIHLAAH